jgi:PBP1b-binding outer membrane lipoprotein LpoB
MKRMMAALASSSLLASALFLSGCASDLAQGYRSTPDYPDYAEARDGENDAIECATNLAGMAFTRNIERQIERQTGRNVKSGNPSGSDWLGSLAMAFVTALAADRSPDVSDGCAAAAAAENSARRRDGL